nr:hypothetical protein GCM10017745_55160 [Saccharothrix mutabilis subsp. capreolus]
MSATPRRRTARGTTTAPARIIAAATRQATAQFAPSYSAPAARLPISPPTRHADSYTPIPRPTRPPDASAITACCTGSTAAHASPLNTHNPATTYGFGAHTNPTANAQLASDAVISTRDRPNRTTYPCRCSAARLIAIAPGRNTYATCTTSSPNPRCRCNSNNNPTADSAAMVITTANSIGRSLRPTAPSPPASATTPRPRGRPASNPAATAHAAAHSQNSPPNPITPSNANPATNATHDPVSCAVTKRGNTAESAASRSLTIARTATHNNAPPAPPTAAAA